MPLVASFDRIIWISETWEQFQSDQSNSQMNHSVRFANQFIEKNQLIHKSDSAIAIVDQRFASPNRRSIRTAEVSGSL